jgi:hypothetical protein
VLSFTSGSGTASVGGSTYGFGDGSVKRPPPRLCHHLPVSRKRMRWLAREREWHEARWDAYLRFWRDLGLCRKGDGEEDDGEMSVINDLCAKVKDIVLEDVAGPMAGRGNKRIVIFSGSEFFDDETVVDVSDRLDRAEQGDVILEEHDGDVWNGSEKHKHQQKQQQQQRTRKRGRGRRRTFERLCWAYREYWTRFEKQRRH